MFKVSSMFKVSRKLSNTRVDEFLDTYRQRLATEKGKPTLAGQNLRNIIFHYHRMLTSNQNENELIYSCYNHQPAFEGCLQVITPCSCTATFSKSDKAPSAAKALTTESTRSSLLALLGLSRHLSSAVTLSVS